MSLKKKTILGGKMKRVILSVIAITVLLLLGCDKSGNNDLLVSPKSSQQTSVGQKVQPNWIVLPSAIDSKLTKKGNRGSRGSGGNGGSGGSSGSGSSGNSGGSGNSGSSGGVTTTVSKLINGSDESLVEINTGYAGGPFGWVSITANARFQRNSFTGQKLVTMSVNDQFGEATFSPSGSFSKPVIYNLTIQGVDLSNVNPANVKFVYMADDGNYYVCQCQQIYVEKQSGKLQVINALLPHFSRYGFTN